MVCLRLKTGCFTTVNKLLKSVVPYYIFKRIVKLINKVLGCEFIESVKETQNTKKQKYQLSEFANEILEIETRNTMDFSNIF